MNLTTAPWIPVVTPDGAKTRVSLLKIFEQGETIRDLAVNPPQRIALMRLLICITQAALDGPKDEKDWYDCRNMLCEAGVAYLKKWQHTFNLYGNQPFLQVPDLSVKKGNEKDAIKHLGTLDFQSPYGGSNTPLFDHASIMPDYSVPDTDIPLTLLTVLNFSTGGRTGQGQWQGQQYSHQTFAAPCVKHLHTFVLGKTLMESIHWNLLCKKDGLCGIESLPNGKWGRPLWELFPESPDDSNAFKNATQTYLGRLVPFSRMINLTAYPGRCIMGPTPPDCKIEHLPGFREPSTTVVLNKKQEPYYFSISSDKHIWRDLGAVLAQGNHSTDMQGAAVLRRVRHHGISETLFPDKIVEIWTGGLETAGDAKLSDILEWNLSVPLNLFNSSELSLYEKGVKLTQTGENHLKDAVKEWGKDMCNPQKKKNQPQKAKGNQPWKSSYIQAQTYYWSFLDNHYHVLIETVDRQNSLSDHWYKIVRNAMRNAFSQACPHTTPRQIRAFSKGRLKLWLKKPEK